MFHLNRKIRSNMPGSGRINKQVYSIPFPQYLEQPKQQKSVPNPTKVRELYDLTPIGRPLVPNPNLTILVVAGQTRQGKTSLCKLLFHPSDFKFISFDWLIVRIKDWCSNPVILAQDVKPVDPGAKVIAYNKYINDTCSSEFIEDVFSTFVLNEPKLPDSPDSAPVSPDSAPVPPDSAPVPPDSAPVSPDSAPVSPDSAPPDSAPVPAPDTPSSPSLPSPPTQKPKLILMDGQFFTYPNNVSQIKLACKKYGIRLWFTER